MIRTGVFAMGAQLQAAFSKLTGVLKKQAVGENITGSEGGSQRGGTCGLYSLWYASIMLRTIDPKAPEIWPRRRNNLAGTPGESLRHFAKHTVKSGQGEILNLTEMVQCILQINYKYKFNAFDESGRGRFITEQLAAEHPVLLPYLEGGPPPACFPVRDKTDPDSGAHWALIYDEAGSEYVFIDPHKPNTPQRYEKSLVLDANLLVDAPEFRFQTTYNKEGFDSWGYKGPQTYNLGNVTKRSRLEGLLISVYY